MASGPSSFQSGNSRNIQPIDMSGGIPKRNRTGPRGPARNRESLDLDDVMDVDEEISFGPPPMTPKAAAPNGTSSSTRDLIDFLSEGPPDLPSLPPIQTNGLNEKPVKSGGRLRSMFSRGNRQQSTEVLNMSPSVMQPKNINGPSTLARSNSSLKKQRSAGNLTAPKPIAQPFPPHEFPRPPNYVRSSAPPSPTLASPVAPASPPESMHSPSQERNRHISVSRKAVPAWEGGAGPNSSLPVPSPTMGSRTPSENRAPPSPKPSTSSISGTHREGSYSHSGHTNMQTPTKESPSSPTMSPPTPHSASSRRAGLIPAARSAGIPNLPAAKAVDVVDMRKKLANATSVPEARLLVDMFLAQWGFTATALNQAELAAEITPAITLNGGPQDDDAGVGVVEMLLGEGTQEVRTVHLEDQVQALGVSSTSSPTVLDTPLTPNSFSTARMPSHSPSRGVRVDVKPGERSGSVPTPTSANGREGHGPMHHHRYGNGNVSPVVVG